MARQSKKNGNREHSNPQGRRFPERSGDAWSGRLVDYKEVELLRKFMTSSSKLMSRKRAGTNAQEQRALQLAVKQARFLALLSYRGA